MMSRPTLVTGAAGFAGSHLVDLLTSSGTEVIAWHRPGGSPPRRDGSGASWEAVDLLDADQVRAAIARVRPSAVYHCAGAAHVGRAWSSTAPTFATNVLGTHHVLQAVERAGGDARVMVPSSALVYSSADEALTEAHPLLPSSPYGLSQLAQEMLASRASSSLAVVIARPFNHFGPRQDPHFVASGFARRIADIEAGRWAPEIAVGNLEARRDLTDVRDTVRAYRLILERGQPGRPYNICSGRAISIRELLERMIARARVPVEVIVDPARYRPNDTPLLLGDPARLHDELGWAPEIPLEKTLDDLLEYWRHRTS
jgi:GDP-4-dehydro-6-deoxy-D-mannose reductase